MTSSNSLAIRIVSAIASCVFATCSSSTPSVLETPFTATNRDGPPGKAAQKA
jgi:hypothetical protein